MQVRGNDSRSHRKDSYDYALTEAREAHWWALATTALLEGKIERLSQSVSRKRSTSHWSTCSHDYLRKWSRGCPRSCTKTWAGGDPSGVLSVMLHCGDHQGRCIQSPSPTHLRRWVTFQEDKTLATEDSSLEWMEQVSGGGEPTECNLGPPPTLKPEFESFLEEQAPIQDAKEGCNLPPEPFQENYKVW